MPPAHDQTATPHGLIDLRSVVASLLRPPSGIAAAPGDGSGCPWCATITAPELLTWLQSEVIETAKEIDEVRALTGGVIVESGPATGRALAKARGELEAEIGDMIFDTFLMAGLAERDGLGVSLDGAATRACAKLRRRCPYVFGGEVARCSEDAERIWQRVKMEEKAEAAAKAKAAVGATIPDAARSDAMAGDVLIFVTKFPTRGKSKTRLIPALGEQGALDMARALVSDAVVNFGQAPELAQAQRVLLFAPADAEADLRGFIRSLGPELLDAWTLVPMANSADLVNPDLGGKLAAGLDAVRKHPSNTSNGAGSTVPCGGSVCFMGMDSPEIRPAHVANALAHARRGSSAYMCPATDGGYTLLALPPAASNKVFRGVEWSTDHTCLSQANAIAKCGIPVLVGPTFHDVDEVEDLIGLRDRVLGATTPEAMAVAVECPRVTSCLERYLSEGAHRVSGADRIDVGRGPGPRRAGEGPPAWREWVGVTVSFVAGSAAMWVVQQAAFKHKHRS